MPSGNVHDEFLKIVQAGTEEEAKAFLVAHIKEFSPDEQQAIALAFLQDAAEEEGDAAAAAAGFQQESIDLFKGLSDAKRELEKQNALLEVKEKI